MITFRRITADEVPQAAEFAAGGMDLARHPGVRLSQAKMIEVARHFAASTADFHLAAFDEAQRLVGVIAACVTEMLTFERCEAHVVLCQARGVPGVGRTLIAELRRWADEDMRVRRIQFPEEIGARPGFARLLRRYGFTRVQRVCLYEKE